MLFTRLVRVFFFFLFPFPSFLVSNVETSKLWECIACCLLLLLLLLRCCATKQFPPPLVTCIYRDPQTGYAKICDGPFSPTLPAYLSTRLTNPWGFAQPPPSEISQIWFSPAKSNIVFSFLFFSGTRQSTWLLLQRRKKGVRSLSPPPPPVYFFSPLLMAFSAPSRFPSPFKCLFSYLLARVLGNGGRRKWTRENAK